MNKSLVTNIISIILIIAGHFTPVWRPQILSMGYFAFSGAITNWLAIYMLFEKIPGLYGSGVIPSRFEEFKSGIKILVMGQFFTSENLDRFFHEQGAGQSLIEKINFDGVINSLDYNQMFQKLLEVVQSSSLGSMLAMFGGANALSSLQAPFEEKMKETMGEITKSEQFINALEVNMLPSNISHEVKAKVESIVDQRLNELTPKMVKEIIQAMIRQHLGWLVVWGGVFGGLIGLFMSFYTQA